MQVPEILNTMDDSPVIRLVRTKLAESGSMIERDFENLFGCAEQQVSECTQKIYLIDQYAALMSTKYEALVEEILKREVKHDVLPSEETIIRTQVSADVHQKERVTGRKSLLRFSTEEYCDSASPSTLVMQVYYPLEVRGEVFD
ncbi:unnamed protein product, partial [Allacma fusca]